MSITPPDFAVSVCPCRARCAAIYERCVEALVHTHRLPICVAYGRGVPSPFLPVPLPYMPGPVEQVKNSLTRHYQHLMILEVSLPCRLPLGLQGLQNRHPCRPAALPSGSADGTPPLPPWAMGHLQHPYLTRLTRLCAKPFPVSLASMHERHAAMLRNFATPRAG